MKKFELTSDYKVFGEKKLFRIKALVDFGDVKIGTSGGYIEKEDNLSQDGNAWVGGDALVYGNAWVGGDAQVYGNALVSGNARVCGKALVYDDAWVGDDALVYGNARIAGNARVYGKALVYGNARIYDDAQDIEEPKPSAKKEEPKTFRNRLIEMVKASGQEVIDRAEDLVGDGDLISDFDIWLRFPTDGRMITGCPTIEVTRSHLSKKSFGVLVGKDEASEE